MKIIQVITKGDELYGAQKHVLDLAIFLAGDGHEILVLVGTTGRLTEELAKNGIPWQSLQSLQREINLWKDYKVCRELNGVIKEFQPDIVASHSSKAGIISRLVCWRLGIKNTFTAHGWSFEDGVPFVKRTAYRWIERLFGIISDKIITVSKQGMALAVENRIVPKRKLAMVYNGSPDFGITHQKSDQGIFTMTMVAGFREQKDHATLIRALGGLRDEQWQLYFLGDGPLLDDCKQLAEECRVGDKIVFAGAVNDVPEYLAKTDLLLLITKWEGLPISTIEGLSLSLPVISSDVSGVREQVIDGYNGLLVERGDVNGVQQAIALLLNSPDECKKYGANSRKLYEEHFTNTVMCNKTKKVYESLI